jgi:tyrosyl-tRNA synthetase
MRGAQLYCITCPLLTKTDGSKMGKTESGTVWLSAERTSPYEFYQYWIRVADEDAGRCLRFLTELSHDEILSLDQARQDAPEKKDSQRRLAEEVTRLVHGETGLQAAQRATEVLYGAEISDLSDAQFSQIFRDVPSCELSRGRLVPPGILLVDALVESKLCASKSEARRTIQQGGAYINNRREESVDRLLTEDDLASETTIVLRAGKKKYALLRFPLEG